MKKPHVLIVLFSSFLFANCFTSQAQFSTCYVVTGIPYAPDSLTSPTPLSLASDDSWSGVINIGFPFCFFGNTYTQCIIGSNGCIGFNLSNANGYQSWPINSALPSPVPADMKNTIMLPWQDLYTHLNGSISYQVLGAVPNRKFVVRFQDIALFSCNNLLFTGQAALCESSNSIEITITNKPLCAQWNGGMGIEGIQNEYGTLAVIVPYTNYPNQWSVTNEAVRIAPTCQCSSMIGPDVISGHVYRDLNNNCISDVGDQAIPYAMMSINSNMYFTADSQGYFVLNVDTGNFDINQVALANHYIECPASGYNVVFNSSPQTFPNADFADTVMHCQDISVGLIGSIQRPCRSNHLYATVCNLGYYPSYNTIATITLHDSTYLVSPLNYSSNPFPNIYEYNLGTIQPQQCVTLTIVDSVDCAVSVGELFCFNASVTADSLDCNLQNNWDRDCEIIRNSWDPNDKLVASQNFSVNSYVTQENIQPSDTLTYRIDFQNTGNANAVNVVVADTISPYLDLGTIRVIAATHSYHMAIAGNVVLFSFNNIMLPDSNSNESASHGSIKFSILQHAGNSPGTIIHNTAGIYFDVNLPIITNQTENTIATPLNVSKLSNSSIKVYPNPTSSSITIQSSTVNALQKVMLYSMEGKLIKSIAGSQSSVVNLDLSDLSSGIYYLDCLTEKAREKMKLIKY
jgi:uncharacterized repeat protein (TIGR01451 family)